MRARPQLGEMRAVSQPLARYRVASSQVLAAPPSCIRTFFPCSDGRHARFAPSNSGRLLLRLQPLTSKCLRSMAPLQGGGDGGPALSFPAERSEARERKGIHSSGPASPGMTPFLQGPAGPKRTPSVPRALLGPLLLVLSDDGIRGLAIAAPRGDRNARRSCRPRPSPSAVRR